MAQFLRPASTISQGTWLAEPVGNQLWQSINEVTPDDTSYITKTNVGACEIGLSSGQDPLQAVNHTFRWRCRAQTGSSTAERLTVQLKQGATVIASKITTLSRTAYVTDSMVLSAAQADAITNYADLRLNFNFSTGAATEVARVSWAELEVPDAAGVGPDQWQLVLSGGTFDGLRFTVPKEQATVGRSYDVIRPPSTVVYAESVRDVAAGTITAVGA